jgi:hypothetical protein
MNSLAVLSGQVTHHHAAAPRTVSRLTLNKLTISQRGSCTTQAPVSKTHDKKIELHDRSWFCR